MKEDNSELNNNLERISSDKSELIAKIGIYERKINLRKNFYKKIRKEICNFIKYQRIIGEQLILNFKTFCSEINIKMGEIIRKRLLRYYFLLMI